MSKLGNIEESLDTSDVSVAAFNGLFSVLILFDLFEMPDSVKQSHGLIYLFSGFVKTPILFSARYSIPSICDSLPSELVHTR